MINVLALSEDRLWYLCFITKKRFQSAQDPFHSHRREYWEISDTGRNAGS